MSADPHIIDGAPDGVNDADQLAADGVEIELGGATFPLRFTFAGLRHVERAYGSYDAFSDAVLAGFSGEILGTLETGIMAGLKHVENVPPAVLEQLVQDALGPPLDHARLESFHGALMDACVEAGLLVRRAKSPPAEGEAANPTGSPGSGGTTSRRSGSGGRRRNSGG